MKEKLPLFLAKTMHFFWAYSLFYSHCWIHLKEKWSLFLKNIILSSICIHCSIHIAKYSLREVPSFLSKDNVFIVNEFTILFTLVTTVEKEIPCFISTDNEFFLSLLSILFILLNRIERDVASFPSKHNVFLWRIHTILFILLNPVERDKCPLSKDNVFLLCILTINIAKYNLKRSCLFFLQRLCFVWAYLLF